MWIMITNVIVTFTMIFLRSFVYRNKGLDTIPIPKFNMVFCWSGINGLAFIYALGAYARIKEIFCDRRLNDKDD